MKPIIRLAILLLVCCTVLPLLGACSSGKDPQEQTTTEQATEEGTASAEPYSDDPEYPGLEAIEANREFTFLGRVYDYGAEPYLFKYSEIEDTGDPGEIVNAAVVRRNTYIEDKYKISIFIDKQIPSNIVPRLETDMISGDHSYDVVMPILNTAMIAACRGLLTEWNTIPHLDESKSYWMTDLFNLTSVGGYHFFCAGDINLSAYNTVQTTFFNKKMHNEFGLENIYSLAREGKWTVEKMMEMAAVAGRDVTNDGTGTTDDIYGVLSATMIWQPMFYATGMTIVTKDGNDLPSLSALKNDTDRFYSIITNITDLVNRHNTAAITSAVGLKGGAAFKANQTLFWVECIYGQFTIRDMEADYGIVPIPVWNEGDPYISNVHSGFTSVTCVPNQFSESRLNLVGSVLEDMAFYSKKIVIPEYYEKTICLKNVRDSDSYEMLALIYDHVIVDMALVLPGLTLDADIRDIVGSNKAGSIASTIKGFLPTYEDVLDTIVLAFCKEGAKQYS